MDRTGAGRRAGGGRDDPPALEIHGSFGRLGGIQFLNGIWITISPSSFYEDFPLGRGWVEALPAYNEHLMRDVGGLFLATGFILLSPAAHLEAASILDRPASPICCSRSRTRVFHLFNLEPYGTGDAIGNVVALAATVVLPLWLLCGDPIDEPATSSPPPAP